MKEEVMMMQSLRIQSILICIQNNRADMGWVLPTKRYYNQRKTHSEHNIESDLVYNLPNHRGKYYIFDLVDHLLSRSRDLSEYLKDRVRYLEKDDRVLLYFYYRDLRSG